MLNSVVAATPDVKSNLDETKAEFERELGFDLTTVEMVVLVGWPETLDSLTAQSNS